MWHPGLPPEASEMWDVIAKAMMRREPTHTVRLPAAELRAAAEAQAEISLEDDGSIVFREVRQ